MGCHGFSLATGGCHHVPSWDDPKWVSWVDLKKPETLRVSGILLYLFITNGCV
jgi:hypothetical protein